jgi:hypothetical protein
MLAAIRKEIRVAFSKKAQPLPFRILKWAVFIPLTLFMAGRGLFWPWILGALALSLSVHFFYRYKTRGWTQPYGKWDDIEAGREPDRK